MHLAKLALVTTGLVTATAAAQPAPPAPPPPPPEAPLPSGDPPPPEVQPQPVAPAPMPEPEPQPVPIGPRRTVSQSVLPGVLPTAVGTTFEGRIDVSSLGDSDIFDLTFTALNLHVQYIAPMGLGGYVEVPIAMTFGDSNTEAYLGNLAAGGLYVFRGSNVDGYVRLGLSVDLSDDEEDFGPIGVPLANLVPRPGDAYATGLNTSWIRGGGGLRFERGGLVIGGAAGGDFLLDNDDGQDNGILHLTGSVGVSEPAFGVAAGFTLVQFLDGSEDEGDDDSFISFQAVGDVAIGGGTRVFGAVGLNVDGGAEAFSVGAGVRATIF